MAPGVPCPGSRRPRGVRVSPFSRRPAELLLSRVRARPHAPALSPRAPSSELWSPAPGRQRLTRGLHGEGRLPRLFSPPLPVAAHAAVGTVKSSLDPSVFFYFTQISDGDGGRKILSEKLEKEEGVSLPPLTVFPLLLRARCSWRGAGWAAGRGLHFSQCLWSEARRWELAIGAFGL